ncbi:hypothetical protein GCM10012275_39740 [Longimycelium tulufanense]|uniref:Phage tail tape measure protein domain-containing protein n=1 Tax=Longimycelium tulufanense TaxID=907463 RepID=A0A8J3FV60_9PSEU|nr:phage tail tape measure protein [Longimycelium tulufanense]GGM65228.1 hypothetical protein GCM10012275_39740 [Longimycelium tulufanense]
MALTIGELVGYLRLDTSNFDRKLTAAGRSLSGAGRAMADVGATATTKVSLPLATLGGTALKMGGDFEASMNRVRAVSGATGEDFDQLRSLAKKLGSTTQYSASEAADAMGFLAMAGFKTNDIMTALPGTLDLAAAGNLDLAQAADIASNILSGYGLKTEEIGRLNDVLAKTFTSANVDMRMLGESFKYVGPVAASAGVKFEETAAAIGLLGNAGIQGSEAGTALRGSIARLLSPTKEVSEKLAELGVSVVDSGGKLLPLVDIIRQLEKSGASTADMMTIFGLEAGPAMQALVSQGADALGNLTSELERSGGTASKIASIQMEGLNGSIKGLQSAFEGLMIAVGESGLLGWATRFVSTLTGIVQALSHTDSATLRTITVIGGLAAALGPAAWVVGKLTAATGDTITNLKKLGRALRAVGMAVATNPLGLIVTALALLVVGAVAAYKKFEWFRNGVDTVFRAVRSAIEWVVDAWRLFVDSFTGEGADVDIPFMNAVINAGALARKAFDSVLDTVRLFIGAFTGEGAPVDLPWMNAVIDAAATARAAVDAVLGWLRERWTAFVDWFSPLWEKVTGFVGRAWNDITSTVGAGLDFLRGLWESWGPTILVLVRGYWDSLVAVFSGAWDVLVGVVSGGWEIVTALFTGAWEALSGIVSGGLQIIMGLWDTFAGLFTGDWSRMWDGITSIFGGIWDAITGILSGAWTILTGIISGGWTVIKGLFTGAWTTLSGIVRSGWNVITGLFGDAWNSLIGGVSGGIDSIVGYFTRLPRLIVEAVGDLGSLLIDAGKNIIHGLIRGITSMIGRVGDAMGSIASTIRSFLPSSPAKAGPLRAHPPDQAGATIAQMVADGMRRRHQAIQRAAATIARAATVTVPDPLLSTPNARHGAPPNTARSGPSGAAGAGAPVQVQVTNYYPQAEPTSTTVNRSLQYAGALGVV